MCDQGRAISRLSLVYRLTTRPTIQRRVLSSRKLPQPLTNPIDRDCGMSSVDRALRGGDPKSGFPKGANHEDQQASPVAFQ